MTSYIWPPEQVKAIRVIDGDSIEATLDLGFKLQSTQVMRLARINAPERNDKEKYEKAKKFVQEKLSDLKKVKIVSYKTGKYGRYLCDVFVSGVNLNKELVDGGYAIAYGTKNKTKHK